MVGWLTIFFSFSIFFSLYCMLNRWLTPMIGLYEICIYVERERTKKGTLKIFLYFFLKMSPASMIGETEMKRSNRYNLTCLMASKQGRGRRVLLENSSKFCLFFSRLLSLYQTKVAQDETIHILDLCDFPFALGR